MVLQCDLLSNLRESHHSFFRQGICVCALRRSQQYGLALSARNAKHINQRMKEACHDWGETISRFMHNTSRRQDKASPHMNLIAHRRVVPMEMVARRWKKGGLFRLGCSARCSRQCGGLVYSCNAGAQDRLPFFNLLSNRLVYCFEQTPTHDYYSPTCKAI